MKISYSYLKNFLNTQLSQKNLSEAFTKVGIECDVKGEVIEFDITPNRGDILSLRGLHREFNVVQSKSAKTSLEVSKIKTRFNKSIIKKIDKSACSNYHLLLIKGIEKLKELDTKKRNFLSAAGIPLINPLVDLGNYVMLEIGSPMHVFDLDSLSLPINVVFPNSDENPFQAIGGDLKNINRDSLTIQDKSGIQAIAGIVGGEESAVKKNTRNIAIEAAFFKPEKIVNQARRYGLATDASHRFERGVDPSIQKLALERYLFLLREISNFKSMECYLSEHKHVYKKPVNFSIERFNSFSGLNFKIQEVKKILKILGINLFSETNKNCKFLVPSHRFDIKIEEDLYEELLRCFGYDNVPNTSPKLGPKKQIPSKSPLSAIKLGLVHLGFKELMHMPFVSIETNNLLLSKSFKPAELANPINENEPLLRGSLFGPMFLAINSNLKKGYSSIKVFEHGNVFSQIKSSFNQESHLSGLIYNHELKKNWDSKEFRYDFYSLKAEIKKLLEISGISDIKFKHNKDTKVFTSNAVDIYVSNRIIGLLGEIDLSVTQKLIKKPCFGFELYPNKIILDSSETRLKRFSKFPSSSRDINIIINKSYSFEELDEKIRKFIKKIKYVKSFQLINIYEGKGIPDGSQSMTLRFIFQSNSKSLFDSEISTNIDQISVFLTGMFQASIRY